MKIIVLCAINLSSILFFVLFTSNAIHASAAKPAHDFNVSKSEVDSLRDRMNQAINAFPDQPSEAECVALENLNDEFYHKAQRCKELDSKIKADIQKGHQNLLVAIFHARSRVKKRAIERRMSTGNFRVRDLNVPVPHRLPLANRYRTLADDVALAREIYVCPQTKPYAVHCNNRGWTEPLIAFAKKDNQLLFAALANRAKQHAEHNLHIKIQQNDAHYSGTVRCFAFRAPFEPAQRQLVQKVASLVPYISLHYLHTDEHAPLLIASVVLDQDVYERFVRENPLVVHPDVHVFANENAMAFLEYVHDVMQDNQRLKTKHIKSDLAQFYTEHDEHQAKIKDAVCASLTTALPVVALQGLVNAYLTNEHPSPVHAQPAALPHGAARASVCK